MNIIVFGYHVLFYLLLSILTVCATTLIIGGIMAFIGIGYDE